MQLLGNVDGRTFQKQSALYHVSSHLRNLSLFAELLKLLTVMSQLALRSRGCSSGRCNFGIPTT